MPAKLSDINLNLPISLDELFHETNITSNCSERPDSPKRPDFSRSTPAPHIPNPAAPREKAAPHKLKAAPHRQVLGDFPIIEDKECSQQVAEFGLHISNIRCSDTLGQLLISEEDESENENENESILNNHQLLTRNELSILLRKAEEIDNLLRKDNSLAFPARNCENAAPASTLLPCGHIRPPSKTNEDEDIEFRVDPDIIEKYREYKKSFTLLASKSSNILEETVIALPGRA